MTLLPGLLFLLPSLACAVPVENLYQAEVYVTSESDRALRQGAQAGFEQVLVRVSGETDVQASDLIRAALRSPADYYNQYSYELVDQPSDDEAGDETGDGFDDGTGDGFGDGTDDEVDHEVDHEVDDEVAEEEPLKRLVITFDPSSVARLLREAGLPVWGSNRPGVLVWMAVARDGERFLVKGDENLQVIELMREHARRRGLPLLFPLLDLTDSYSISAPEVWGGFLDRVGSASNRYNPDLVLTGRIRQMSSRRWSGKWFWRIADDWQSVESLALSEAELVRDLIDQLADEMAGRYALDSSRGLVRMHIEGVKNLERYAVVAAYLEALTPVTHSTLTGLNVDTVTFDLETEGQYEQLIKIIGLGERMLLLDRDDEGASLRYRWIETR